VYALVVTQLGHGVPIAYALLRLVGAFRDEEQLALPAAAGQPARMAYRRRVIDWGRLGAAIANPANVFADVYHWGDVGGAFDHARFLEALAALVERFPLSVGVTPCSDALYDLFYDR